MDRLGLASWFEDRLRERIEGRQFEVGRGDDLWVGGLVGREKGLGSGGDERMDWRTSGTGWIG
jgi:hypothetical protein